MARPLPAALAAVLLGTTALAGCTGGGTAAGGASAPAVTTSVPAPTAQVGTVTWNSALGEPASLDPALSSIESASTVVANMCEGLFTFGPGYKSEPALATSVDHPDPLTYVFHLRKGATFWDGKPVTPEDVVYSVRRVLNPALGSSWVGWAAHMKSIEPTGADRVTLKLKQPDVLVPSFFALPSFHVVEKAFAEKAGKAFGTAKGGVMCTGPYKFGAWTQGQNITLTRNDAWWNTAVKPKVKDLKFTFIADPAAQTAALASGDVDGQFNVPRPAHKQLSGKGHLLYGQSLAPTFLSVLNQKGALGDPAARQALQALIDYKGITGSVYQGTAQPLRALVPPAAWGYAGDVYKTAYDALPEPVQDLGKARKLVAGSPRAKQKIVLAYSRAIDEESRIAASIADTAKQAGMNVELKPLTGEQFGAMFASPAARAGVDLFLSTGYLDFPEPLEYYQYFTTGSFYNFAGYSDKEYDAAVASALGTAGPAARARLIVKAQGIMTRDLPTIPIATQYVNVYYGARLTGLVPRQDYLYTPWATTLGGK
ncbi:ABC transporter substrate-binding protein [Actinomadura parmotrematis]|uniref:ABC transporter substrate-binding protein n=1 Tax=Actinomadura parmotrematis TaxID=2864039 RepID=A0ABS7FML1_9ACTN|nr:ABC transporter substrate-binding protein [Actinomadura parmotrematis]MBW8481230.1 ABC transporter substrate-binding protein [Actinomadura parmotrematis]